MENDLGTTTNISASSTPTLYRPDAIETDHLGQWFIVLYDAHPYPGISLELEEHNVKLKCMHRNGINKLFCPSPREDINWYSDDQILCLIPEPVSVNKRSVQIETNVWQHLEEHLLI